MLARAGARRQGIVLVSRFSRVRSGEPECEHGIKTTFSMSTEKQRIYSK